MPANPPRPTDAELELLTILWARGPSTVREIHKVATERKPAQYTTVLKLLQIMADKGLVHRDEKERAHVYRAAFSPEQTRQQLASDLMKRAFGGSAASLMQGALSDRKISKAELAELRRLLDEHERRSP
jgi:BlaI family transcriptional regulator, penicillinase repressor